VVGNVSDAVRSLRKVDGVVRRVEGGSSTDGRFLSMAWRIRSILRLYCWIVEVYSRLNSNMALVKTCSGEDDVAGTEDRWSSEESNSDNRRMKSVSEWVAEGFIGRGVAVDGSGVSIFSIDFALL